MTNKRKYIVYVHRNKINKKCYVGITSAKNPKRRWGYGHNYKNNTYFDNSIKKYKWDNFDHIILMDNLSLDDAIEMEKLYIAMLRSNDRDYGYNITSGGDCTGTSYTSKPVCQYGLEGKLINRFPSISKASIATGLSGSFISACCKNKYNLGGGFIWTYDGDTPNFNVKTNKSAVKQYSLDGHFINSFNSMREAEKLTEVKAANISQCCNHKQYTAGGYIWSFIDAKPRLKRVF